MKFIKLLMVVITFASYAQQGTKQKTTKPEFGEMTTLEQFGGPSMGTCNPTQALVSGDLKEDGRRVKRMRRY